MKRTCDGVSACVCARVCVCVSVDDDVSVSARQRLCVALASHRVALAHRLNVYEWRTSRTDRLGASRCLCVCLGAHTVAILFAGGGVVCGSCSRIVMADDYVDKLCCMHTAYVRSPIAPIVPTSTTNAIDTYNTDVGNMSHVGSFRVCFGVSLVVCRLEWNGIHTCAWIPMRIGFVFRQRFYECIGRSVGWWLTENENIVKA